MSVQVSGGSGLYRAQKQLCRCVLPRPKANHGSVMLIVVVLCVVVVVVVVVVDCCC